MIIKYLKSIARVVFVYIKFKIIPWIEKFLISLGHGIHVLLFSKYNPTVKKISIDLSKKCYILGNGPSLKKDLDDHLVFLSECNLFVVNDMSISDYYQRLKPQFYVFADPCYWDINVYKGYSDVAKKVIESIRDRTDWPMFLIIPLEAYRNNNFRNFFSSNKNISLVNYNLITFNGFKFLNSFVYRYYLGMPRPQNVMIPCIYLSINFGFEEINLLGVDHSWTRNLIVNDKNEVYFADSHFYDNGKTPSLPFRTIYGDIYKMHEILFDYAYMFQGYHVINEYAIYRNVKIYNRTVNSYIDAFERKSVIE
jgi:hypothetical protein